MNILKNHTQLNQDGRRKKVFKTAIKRVEKISLVVLIWMAALGAVYVLYYAVVEKGLFKVKNIELEGGGIHVFKKDILDSIDVQAGANLYKVNMTDIQKKLQSNPWVRESAVSRKLPSTLWIYIGEYEPVAIFLDGRTLRFIDSEGTVFKEVGPGDEKNVPVITGVSDKEAITAALDVLKVYMESRLSVYFTPAEVHYDRIKGYSFVLAGLGVVLRVGFNDVSEKLERFYSLFGTISEYKEKMRYVDMNIPGKIVVKYES